MLSFKFKGGHGLFEKYLIQIVRLGKSNEAIYYIRNRKIFPHSKIKSVTVTVN